jgi:hypothetical protein
MATKQGNGRRSHDPDTPPASLARSGRSARRWPRRRSRRSREAPSLPGETECPVRRCVRRHDMAQDLLEVHLPGAYRRPARLVLRQGLEKRMGIDCQPPERWQRRCRRRSRCPPGRRGAYSPERGRPDGTCALGHCGARGCTLERDGRPASNAGSAGTVVGRHSLTGASKVNPSDCLQADDSCGRSSLAQSFRRER